LTCLNLEIDSLCNCLLLYHPLIDSWVTQHLEHKAHALDDGAVYSRSSMQFSRILRDVSRNRTLGTQVHLKIGAQELLGIVTSHIVQHFSGLV